MKRAIITESAIAHEGNKSVHPGRQGLKVPSNRILSFAGKSENRFVLMLIIVFFSQSLTVYSQSFTKGLQSYSLNVVEELDQIDKHRIPTLDSVSAYILNSLSSRGEARVLLVCTHNSRRSHLSQVFLQTAAFFYGVEGIYTYSGGTEVTAANERAVSAMSRAGFIVTSTQKNTSNPAYLVSQGKEFPSNVLYSKKFDDPQNPKENFMAIMVCSDADKSCPFVPGAEKRISLPFKDPRYSDGSPSEELIYDETARLIAREMFYIIKQVKEMRNLEAEKLK